MCYSSYARRREQKIFEYTGTMSRSDHRVVVVVVELRVVCSSGCLLCTRTSRDSFRAGDLGEVLGFRAGQCV